MRDRVNNEIVRALFRMVGYFERQNRNRILTREHAELSIIDFDEIRSKCCFREKVFDVKGEIFDFR